MSTSVLRKIGKAANSYKDAKPAFADNPFFARYEEKQWGHATSFFRTKNEQCKKAKKK